MKKVKGYWNEEYPGELDEMRIREKKFEDEQNNVDDSTNTTSGKRAVEAE